MTGARILMYSQDGLGLGHLRRLTNLANVLVAARPGVSVLLAVNSPVALFFDLAPGVDFVKLPTVVKVDASVFRAGRLLVGYDELCGLRSGILREIALRYDPSLLLVDHMPGGANRELLPALTALSSRGRPTRMVLGLRDIIDRPAVTREVWQREGVYETMARFYHRVLVYGAQEIFATADEYGIAASTGERVRYCGYVCNMAAVEAPAHIRERLELPAGPLVAVTAGGGADGLPLLATVVEAARLLRARRQFTTLMATGPFMPPAERAALQARAREYGVRVQTTVADLLDHIHAADVVVSMAGYNTMSEILRLARRAIIVPRAGPSAEQGMRARLFAQRGFVDLLEPAQLAPAALAAAIERALDGPPAPLLRPHLDGVANATAALLAELESEPLAAASAGGSGSGERATRDGAS